MVVCMSIAEDIPAQMHSSTDALLVRVQNDHRFTRHVVFWRYFLLLLLRGSLSQLFTRKSGHSQKVTVGFVWLSRSCWLMRGCTRRSIIWIDRGVDFASTVRSLIADLSFLFSCDCSPNHRGMSCPLYKVQASRSNIHWIDWLVVLLLSSTVLHALLEKE
jgi:hypothetical protein